jgi:hypothetical protein
LTQPQPYSSSHTATAMSGDDKVRFGKVGDRWLVHIE